MTVIGLLIAVLVVIVIVVAVEQYLLPTPTSARTVNLVRLVGLIVVLILVANFFGYLPPR